MDNEYFPVCIEDPYVSYTDPWSWFLTLYNARTHMPDYDVNYAHLIGIL